VKRVRLNKQVKTNIPKMYDYGDKIGQPVLTKDGQPVFEYKDGPEERFENQIIRFYDFATKQTAGEKAVGKPAAEFEKDLERCESEPIVDKYNANYYVAGSEAQPATAQGFGAATATGGFNTGGFGS
jgi:hypothetical protein